MLTVVEPRVRGSAAAAERREVLLVFNFYREE